MLSNMHFFLSAHYFFLCFFRLFFWSDIFSFVNSLVILVCPYPFVILVCHYPFVILSCLIESTRICNPDTSSFSFFPFHLSTSCWGFIIGIPFCLDTRRLPLAIRKGLNRQHVCVYRQTDSRIWNINSFPLFLSSLIYTDMPNVVEMLSIIVSHLT